MLAGHALQLIVHWNTLKEFCRKAPIQDVPGRPAWWGLYKQSVTLPAQLKPCLKPGGSLTPAEKAAVFIIHPGGCCRLVVSSLSVCRRLLGRLLPYA